MSTAPLEGGDRGASGAPGLGLRLRCVELDDIARRRLEAIGAVLVDDGDHEVDAILVSTRTPPGDVVALIDDAEGGPPVVVLAHTGGEHVAADLVRAGAHSIVGEGNEEALAGLVDPDHASSALLASFERRFALGPGVLAEGSDLHTGLPDNRSFERRLASLIDAGTSVRIARVAVLSDRWTTPSPDIVVSVQRRRLASALAHVCGAAGAELYSTGFGEFAVLAENMGAPLMDRLALRIVGTAATCRDRGLPLRAVVGHAGSDLGGDGDNLVNLARRAVEAAAVGTTRDVIDASEISGDLSVTTELEAIVRLLDEVEPTLPQGRGHGERVGRMAAELARVHGVSPAMLSRIQLAGHLHDVGRSGVPVDAVDFPERGERMLQLTAGSAVAQTVRSQVERWDGTGRPDGLAREEIVESARILAVAHAIDDVLCVSEATSGQLAVRLRERAGHELDPTLVGVALSHLTLLLSVRG